MARVWVVDASPVIVLARVDKLDLLDRLGDGVFLPEPVAIELSAGPLSDAARTAVDGGWGTLTGTLGVVARAFKAGLIDSLPNTIEELRHAGLYADEALVAAVLRWARESPG